MKIPVSPISVASIPAHCGIRIPESRKPIEAIYSPAVAPDVIT
jgi:hypothetical protein